MAMTRKLTAAEDAAYDKKHGVKPGSSRDKALDKKFGVKPMARGTKGGRNPKSSNPFKRGK